VFLIGFGLVSAAAARRRAHLERLAWPDEK
jgi:hypothetical protein